MKALIEFIAKSLVDQPGEVSVTETGGGKSVTLELHVAADDMGRVIGRSGRVANAMRTVLRVPATRNGKRVNLEIV